MYKMGKAFIWIGLSLIFLSAGDTFFNFLPDGFIHNYLLSTGTVLVCSSIIIRNRNTINHTK